MRIPLELNIPDDRMFLNFWDNIHGNDVVAQIVDGKIMIIEYDEQGDEKPEREISFQEFVTLVLQSIAKRTI